MSRTTDFRHIAGVARVDWTIATQTPLCIKSGTTSALDKEKNRIIFQNKTSAEDKNQEGSVQDFYFDIRFNGSHNPDAPTVVFRIPASSVRGALRNYTIKRLVPKDLRAATLFDKKEEAEIDEATLAQQAQTFQQALGAPGWHLIQNLFGMAADSGDDALEDETVAGRLRVLSDDIICREADLNHLKKSPLDVVSRSPLDRATRGTKDGGLHSFMELKPNHTFKVGLQIINPAPEDLGFVAFWENSINQGLVRLGGLVSVGKGRLQVKKTDVRLYARNTSGFQLTGKAIEEKDESKNTDILADLLPQHRLNWKHLKGGYLNKLKTKYEQLGKGA